MAPRFGNLLSGALRSSDDAADALTRAKSLRASMSQADRTIMMSRMRDSMGMDPKDIDNYENIMKGKEDLVDDLLKRAEEANVAGDITTARALAEKAEKTAKSLDKLTDHINKVTDASDLKKLNQAAEQVDDAAEAVKETTSFCGKPGRMKYCVGAGVGVTVGGYYTLKAWNKLEEDKKQCLNVCYPDDWKAAKAQRRPPTYKTETAVNPNDNTIRYEALYPDMADTVCTPDNMTKSGKSNCDDFCKTKCDYDLDDLLDEVVSEAGDDVGSILDKIFGSIFGSNWKKWLIGIAICLLFLLMIPLVIRLIPN